MVGAVDGAGAGAVGALHRLLRHRAQRDRRAGAPPRQSGGGGGGDGSGRRERAMGLGGGGVVLLWN